MNGIPLDATVAELGALLGEHPGRDVLDATPRSRRRRFRRSRLTPSTPASQETRP